MLQRLKDERTKVEITTESGMRYLRVRSTLVDVGDYVHGDSLGSTRLVLTSLTPPTVSFSSDYVPYGQNYGSTGSESFMYTGKPFDSATGLYYYGARYYDPTTGRFVTEDTYGGRMTDPQSMDRYVYARDNPMRYNDPSGHSYNGRMFTDFDDPYVTQSTSCVNGVCTVTMTESYGGYTSSISTTMGIYTSGGTSTAWWGTTMTDTNPGGSTRTRSAYSQTRYADVQGAESGPKGGAGPGITPDQANAFGKQAFETVGLPQLTGPMILADAAAAPFTIGVQDYNDINNGGPTIQDSVNTGLVIGAWIGIGVGLFCAPEIVIPMLAVAGFAGDANSFGL